MQRKDCVRRHGNTGCDIAHAEALQIERTAMLLDQDDGARQLAGGYLVVEERGDALELFRRGRFRGMSCPDDSRPKRGREGCASESTERAGRGRHDNRPHPRKENGRMLFRQHLEAKAWPAG